MTPMDSVFFDVWSHTYDRAVLQESTYRPVHDALLDRIASLSPTTVLDLGCGTGQLTRRLITTFPDAGIIGVDLSSGMLERAVESDECNDASFALADAQRLPLSPGSVDVVVCSESFHWYTDQPAALDGLHTLLKPGGRLLIASIATLTGTGDEIIRRTTSMTGRSVRAVPRRRLRKMLEAAGFDVTYQGRIMRLGPIPWPVLTDATRI